MDTAGQYITTIEAAQRLGVTQRRVQQYITAGRLPARKFGRDLWIDVRDLAAFQRRPAGRPPVGRRTGRQSPPGSSAR